MKTSPYSYVMLKRSAIHFFIGKIASGLLNMGILLWLVRLLALEDYGAYVSLIAGMELALAITSVGVPWVAARYLPDFVLHASGKQLTQFVWQVIGWVFLFTIIGALLLYMAMPWLLSSLNLAHHVDIARVFLFVFVLEGLRRTLQECILEPLLLQSQAQLSQVIRNLGLLLFLVFITTLGSVQLSHVVLAESVGAILGTVSALRGLIRYLYLNQNLQGKNSWQPPCWSEMRRTALHMYFSYLVTLTYSQYIFIFIIQRFLGVEATALFGFIVNLSGQISRYLPSTLLFGLIRPKLIASYVGEGGITQLTRNANLVGKLSLFVLMPILVFVWLAGDELLNLLSSNKFTQAENYLGGLLLALIPFSQRQILETVAVVCGKSHLCFRSSALGVLTLPVVYWLLEDGQGLWWPILATIVSQILFNANLVFFMALTTAYRPDVTGLFKQLAAALMGFFLALLAKIALIDLLKLNTKNFAELFVNTHGNISWSLVQQIEMSTHHWLDLSIMAALAFGLFLLASYFFKPFRADERMRLNNLLKRNVFIW